MIVYLIYFFLLNIIFDLLSSKTSLCILNKPNVLYILLFHHVINSFILLGCFFNNLSILLFHFIIIIITIIYWMYNKNYCDLTLLVNKMCGWKEDLPFNDIFNIVGLKKIKQWNEFWHYLIIMISGIISFSKIIKIVM